MTTKSIFPTVILIGLMSSKILTAQINPTKNIIGVDVSTFPQNASFNYDSCFTLGVDLGMSSTGIYQNWTAIEVAPNTFDLTNFDIANFYYPAYNMPIDLTITPIHTNNLEVPSDLVSMPFDNPIFINRFKILLDSVKDHIPNVTLTSLVIGSEHDVYLGTNSTLWTQYIVFYDAVSTYAKTLWPGLKIASELTYHGITTQNTFAQILNTNSDYVGVSYYPLNNDFTVKPVSTIPSDFATLVGLYPSKPICFYQYGYPSGALCNSSETLQAQFIAQTFTTWDSYANNVKMIDFTWLHDLDDALVNYYGSYYGITDPIFLEYLRTLGLRSWNGSGTDKKAFIELQRQAKQRGYNSLIITGISDKNSDNDFIKLFPNPVQNRLNIDMPIDFVSTKLRIYNQLGQAEKIDLTITEKNIYCETSDLVNGLYFIVLQNGDRNISRKFIVSK